MHARTKMFSVLGLSLAILGAVGANALAGKDDKAVPPAAKIGEKAPAWQLTDITGKQWESSDFENKIVVMEWVNPKCPVCRTAHEDGRIPKMIEELKELGAEHIAINSTHDTNAEANKKALERYGVEYPVLLDLDGSLARLYGARTTPHMFVIDTEGVLRYSGAIDDNPRGNKEPDAITNYAIQAVKQIQAGETVSPETTKPYGCSVKFPPGKSKDKKNGKKEDSES